MSNMELTMGIHNSDLQSLNMTMTELMSLVKKYLPKNRSQAERANQAVDLLPPIGNQHPHKGLFSSFLSASNVVLTMGSKYGGDGDYPNERMLIMAVLLII